MQNFYRDALGIAMRRRVDSRHPAHANELVEVPSAIEECADARLCAQSYEVRRFHVGLSPRRYGRVEVGLRRGPGRQKPTKEVPLRLEYPKLPGYGGGYFEIKPESAANSGPLSIILLKAGANPPFTAGTHGKLATQETSAVSRLDP